MKLPIYINSVLYQQATAQRNYSEFNIRKKRERKRRRGRLLSTKNGSLLEIKHYNFPDSTPKLRFNFEIKILNRLLCIIHVILSGNWFNADTQERLEKKKSKDTRDWFVKYLTLPGRWMRFICEFYLFAFETQIEIVFVPSSFWIALKCFSF